MGVARMKYSLIPRENKVMIYEYLMREGVLVVQKDPKIPSHPEISVPNLHVLMTMKSLKSKNFVDENFNWQHLYFTLTDQGIEYLRNFLHLPPTVFPATLTKKQPMKASMREEV
ncbi:bifunctional 40S Ribosomal protein S10/Plectin-S10 [Babesia duncani]|uniref:Bifunctional 40S Ribosomal protein S10/Plectin-S10 n=1 Tax=Babesia duncani TaxID=323732 RepID=A0AAD9UP34_9APIC|nr:bifunctional 40S Ribosomal protein S10/Plectin-S10 [Babesia duncani]